MTDFVICQGAAKNNSELGGARRRPGGVGRRLLTAASSAASGVPLACIRRSPLGLSSVPQRVLNHPCTHTDEPIASSLFGARAGPFRATAGAKMNVSGGADPRRGREIERRSGGGTNPLPAGGDRRRGSSMPIPGLGPFSHSYQDEEAAAGLLRKLLKRRGSGSERPTVQVGGGAWRHGRACRCCSCCCCLGHAFSLLQRWSSLSDLTPCAHSHRSQRAQPPPLSSQAVRRNRDKLVALLEEGQLAALDSGEAALASPGPNPGLSASSPATGLLAGTTAGEDELLPAEEAAAALGGAATGRISIHCTAASYDLTALKEHLESGGYRCGVWVTACLAGAGWARGRQRCRCGFTALTPGVEALVTACTVDTAPLPPSPRQLHRAPRSVALTVPAEHGRTGRRHLFVSLSSSQGLNKAPGAALSSMHECLCLRCPVRRPLPQRMHRCPLPLLSRFAALPRLRPLRAALISGR